MTLENFIEESFTGKGVCLVGNGVVEKMHGEFIDSHSVVIRINEYVLLDRFTPFIGNKTTHYCNHGNRRFRSRKHAETLCPFYGRCENDWGGKKICPSKDWRKEMGVKSSTTGSTMLYILDRLKISTNAVGFDFLQTGHMWNPKKNMKKRHPCHFKQIKEEELLIKSLPNVKLL